MLEEPNMHVFPHPVSTGDHILMEKLQGEVLEHLRAMQAIVERTLDTQIEGLLRASVVVGEKWAGPLPRQPVETCFFVFGGSVTELLDQHEGGLSYWDGLCSSANDAAP